MDFIKKLLRSFMCDKKGHIVIWQTPNIPLIGWVLGTLFAKIFSTGRSHTGFTFLAEAFLVAWAYLEVKSGASYFRRILGILVFLSIVMSHFR